MRTTGRDILFAAAVAATLGACAQTSPVVQGSDPGDRRISSAHTSMTSDVQYLGASADGLILVRLPDGTVQG